MSQPARGSQPSLILAILDTLTGTLVAVVRDILINLVGSIGLAAVVIISIPIGLLVLFGVVAIGFVLASFVGMTSPIGIVIVWGSIILGFVALAKVYLAMYRRLEPLGKRFGVLEDETEKAAEAEITALSGAEAGAAEEQLRAKVSELDAQLAKSSDNQAPARTSSRNASERGERSSV